MPTWPDGFHGDLTVFSGAKKILRAQPVWDFRSIYVEEGATLEFDVGPNWVTVGCVENLVVRGVIRSRKANYVQGQGFQAWDGYDLPPPPSIRSGGRGGATWQQHGEVGGSQNAGNGGGGMASGTNGGHASSTSGGNGATKRPLGNRWLCAPGGVGGTIESPNGRDGGSLNADPGGGVIGGGGGGGARGLSGGLFYLRVIGSADLAGSFLDFAGHPGGTGGKGGSAHSRWPGNDIRAGGGGGGGAGGNGGHIVIRHGGVFKAGRHDVQGGLGGSGGQPGQVSRQLTPPPAAAGGVGENGIIGSLLVEQVA